jgi:hypothetical protein
MKDVYDINKFLRDHCYNYDFTKIENLEIIKSIINSLLNTSDLEVGEISVTGSGVVNITIVPKISIAIEI